LPTINPMTANSQEGKCLLCGKNGKLSFEHVPPRAAFNDKPIYIQTSDHLVNEDSHFFGKRMKSNKGFGSYTLCESCNTLTGDWYARDFVEFVHQGMEIISKMQPQPFITGIYHIKPLNVLKQILTMFLSADKGGYLQSLSELTSFILNRHSMKLPSALKVFLYSNLSPTKRMMGYSISYHPSLGVQKWSEINFKPFGYLLAEDSNPAHQDMLDISNFSSYEYDEQVTLELRTRYLKILSPFIGIYL
jgi:hypothetical protein